MTSPSRQTPPAIHARGVSLTLGAASAPVEVLKEIDLDIRQGETVALLGASGSGKSSLMAVLSGLERATQGTIMIANQNFHEMDEDALAKARRGTIGIVLQAFHLLPTMTALENVATPMELAGIADARLQAERELEAVGLAHRLHHYPSQMSGGEQQRVAIARALAPAPHLIFADEPTGNLDAATGHEIVDLLLARCNTAQTSLLVITHDPELAARCNRIITMADGTLVSDSHPVS